LLEVPYAAAELDQVGFGAVIRDGFRVLDALPNGPVAAAPVVQHREGAPTDE
jgi:hypothetical protein